MASTEISTFSFSNKIANIIPKSEEVENIITDFIAPTSFSPIINKNREPAKPPRLKNIRLGTSCNSKLKEIFKIITMNKEIDPPIKDFS